MRAYAHRVTLRSRGCQSAICGTCLGSQQTSIASIVTFHGDGGASPSSQALGGFGQKRAELPMDLHAYSVGIEADSGSAGRYVHPASTCHRTQSRSYSNTRNARKRQPHDSVPDPKNGDWFYLLSNSPENDDNAPTAHARKASGLSPNSIYWTIMNTNATR